MKKIITSIIAAAILTYAAVPAFAGEYYGNEPLPDVNYSDLTINPVSDDELNYAFAKVKKAISDSDSDSLKKAFDDLDALSKRQAQAYVLSNIKASQHNTEENNTASETMYNTINTMSQKTMKLITEYYTNTFFAKEMAKELGGEDALKELIETQPTDKAYELSNKEQELISKYNSMLPENMTFTDDSGNNYTFESIISEIYDLGMKVMDDSTPNEELADFADTYMSLMRRYKSALDQMSERLGELYKEMVEVRTELAKEYGYDNYSDYAYEMLYARDFSSEDSKRLYAAVKEYIVPLQAALLSYNDFTAGSDELNSNEEIISAARQAINDVNSELTESFDYMSSRGFLDICSNDDRVTPGSGYTTELYNSAPPFTFISTVDGNTSLTYTTLIHEFGHYNALLRSEQRMNSGLEDILSSYGSESIDLQEVFSQGLQLLSADNYTSAFDLTDSSIMYTSVLYDIVNSITQGCLYDEWQTEVYKHPYMSIDEINALYGKLSHEYSADSADETEDEYEDDSNVNPELKELAEKENNIHWMYVPHNFTSPMYYISYATSAAAAIDIWSQGRTDYNSAVNKYMTLTANDYYSFRDALSNVGIEDIFEENTIKKIADNINSYIKGGYTDIPDGSWYTSAARFTEPYFDNSGDTSLFRPTDSTTRREAAQTLASLNEYTTGITAEGTIEFEDAKNSPLISWTADAGIIKGYNENTFAPNDTLTREQAVTILYRYCAHEQLMPNGSAEINASSFPDYEDISYWAKDAFGWAINAGIINGKPSGSMILLAPQDTISRAEFAQMLTNMADTVNLRITRG